MDLETVIQSEVSQKEKKKSYINTYMWKVEKSYRWLYLQIRNKDTDIKKKVYGHQGGKEGWDELGNWDWYIYTIDTTYKIGNEWEPTVWYRKLYSAICGDINGRGIEKKRGYMYVYSWYTLLYSRN